MENEKFKEIDSLLASGAISEKEYNNIRTRIIKANGGISKSDKRLLGFLKIILGCTFLWFVGSVILGGISRSDIQEQNVSDNGWTKKEARYCKSCGRVNLTESGAYECIPFGERTNHYAKYRSSPNGENCMVCCMNYLCE